MNNLREYEDGAEKRILSNGVGTYSSLFIGSSISLIALLVSFFIFFSSEDKGIYKYIYYVPMCYAVLNLIFNMIYARISIFKFLLLALMFMRYIVGPFFIFYEKFPENLYFQIFSEDTIVKATFLMCYEMACIFFVVWLLEKKRKNEKKKNYNLLLNRNFSTLNPILLLIIFVTMGIFIVYPGLFRYYYLIFDNSIQETVITSTQEIQNSVPGGIRWIGFSLGELTRYIVIAALISFFYKRYTINQSKFYIIVTILIIVLNAMVTTSRQMAGIIMSIVFYIQILMMFPKERIRIIAISVISMLIFGIVLILTYFKESISYHTVTSILESYTNGFYEIYQSLQAFELTRIDLFEKYQMFLIGDTLGYVNVISSFISNTGGNNTSLIFNHYLYGSGLSGGHIVPMVSQGYLYFGIIFSTTFSILTLVLMYYFEKQIELAKGNYICFMFSGILFAIATVMYNYSIVIVLMTTVVLPIYIASILNSVKIKS